jgi:acyl-CoA synthetase (AMP-forming)/AMP-acid ligase II
MGIGPQGANPVLIEIKTLKALAEASFARWRDRPACTSLGVSLTYGELERGSAAFGAFLRLRLGLAPGERVLEARDRHHPPRRPYRILPDRLLQPGRRARVQRQARPTPAGHRSAGTGTRRKRPRRHSFVVAGFKAYPSEIESVALAHPGVKDAGAVGVPHGRTGEAVALVVVKRDPALSAEALAEHCAQRLALYKRPARIVFRDSLPKSPLGKVLHRQLKASL